MERDTSHDPTSPVAFIFRTLFIAALCGFAIYMSLDESGGDRIFLLLLAGLLAFVIASQSWAYLRLVQRKRQGR